jgi:hypothetical protein
MPLLPETRLPCVILLVFAAACVLQPVMAETGGISIAYRGSGGSYIGETVVFDGLNTYGNTTFIKIAGPGLPAEGVPANNLNGPAGTGTPVEGDQHGEWRFGWYASSVPGIEKLRTGRYTFTATDSVDRTKSATSLWMLKKPEYRITASPNPVEPGNYIELIGTAETGITTARIEILDASGKVVHTYTSPVSSSGYFSYSFHEDMGPGQYQVKVSNPSLKASFGTALTVAREGSPTAVAPVVTKEQVTATPTPDIPSVDTPAPDTTTTPKKSPVSPPVIFAGLIAVIIITRISRR